MLLYEQKLFVKFTVCMRSGRRQEVEEGDHDERNGERENRKVNSEEEGRAGGGVTGRGGGQVSLPVTDVCSLP